MSASAPGPTGPGGVRGGGGLKVLFATSNPYKLAEARDILAPLGVEIRGLNDVGAALPEPVEDRPTFEGNAEIKARHYARELGQACLADDSGLEVDALGGAPGVLSARYAGAGGSREQRDRANNEKLLRELAGVSPERRTARFVCALCLTDVHGEVLATARGSFEGVIAERPRGEGGFGYDPLLIVPELGQTSAELSPSEKNERSHRGQALRQLVAGLRAHFPSGGVLHG